MKAKHLWVMHCLFDGGEGLDWHGAVQNTVYVLNIAHQLFVLYSHFGVGITKTCVLPPFVLCGFGLVAEAWALTIAHVLCS